MKMYRYLVIFLFLRYICNCTCLIIWHKENNTFWISRYSYSAAANPDLDTLSVNQHEMKQPEQNNKIKDI